MILRVPDYYEEFACIASACHDSCCAGWEIDIDEDSYAYYSSVEGAFAPRLKESIYKAEDGYRFRLKGEKRCAMLNDDNLCDLYTALGEEALCEVCTEYPRYFICYGDVEQKGLSLSCEEAGRILFSREEREKLTDIELPGSCDDGEDDPVLVSFLEWVQEEATAILQDRSRTIPQRMRMFLRWCEQVQEEINRAQAKDDFSVLTAWQNDRKGKQHEDAPQEERCLSYGDFLERFAVFSEMEELDGEWIHTKEAFEALYREDTYEARLLDYLQSPSYSALGYEHLLVYFVWRYLMNAVYDKDVLTYGKLVVVSTLVVRDMDAARFAENGGSFTLFDRIDTARIFSKEVEHSEGNADALREMCMMEPIAHADALCRQI